MKWYRNLYVSNSIGDKANRIKWKINHNAGTISVYVIAFASNSQNLLDIPKTAFPAARKATYIHI